MTKFRVVLAGAGLTVAVTACGNGPPPSDVSSSSAGGGAAAAGSKADPVPATPDATVQAKDDLKFTPGTLSVGVGQTVEWINSGTVSHNITFDDPNSALTDATFDAGAKYAVKWTKAGNYTYKCTIHPGMTGEVDVK